METRDRLLTVTLKLDTNVPVQDLCNADLWQRIFEDAHTGGNLDVRDRIKIVEVQVSTPSTPPLVDRAHDDGKGAGKPARLSRRRPSGPELRCGSATEVG